jgi:hypothetical protein
MIRQRGSASFRGGTARRLCKSKSSKVSAGATKAPSLFFNAASTRQTRDADHLAVAYFGSVQLPQTQG